MKNRIIGASFGAFLLFGASFFLSIESSEAASNSIGQEIDVTIDCKGTAGHCFEYKGTTYYGKAHVSDL